MRSRQPEELLYIVDLALVMSHLIVEEENQKLWKEHQSQIGWELMLRAQKLQSVVRIQKVEERREVSLSKTQNEKFI